MRADLFLFSKGLAQSRERAKQIILEGRLSVNGKTISKPSAEICEEDDFSLCESQKSEFVSRGGYKLEAALDHFGLDVVGLCAADIGASTGGFSDCLLQRGIGKIFAVDCGTGQLNQKIAQNPLVVSIENTNARFISPDTFGGELVDIAVMDLSFISQTLIFPALEKILKEGGIVVSLIKPQFEAGRECLNKKGIVKNQKHRDAAIQKVLANASLFGLCSRGVIPSPIVGGDGNIEYLTVFDFKKKQL